MQDLNELRDHLLNDCSYIDGKLFWKKNKQGRIEGREIGRVSHRGYRHVNYRSKTYFVHRLIFLFHHGYLPPVLDHIDGDPLNNKIENLREATRSQNNMNSKITHRNKTGYKGISWVEKEKRYVCTIQVPKNKKIVRRCKTLDEAIVVIKDLRVKYHGEFARHG
jgi:hypothetical protein